MKTQKYKNFQMEYHDPNWVEYIQDYVASGGLATDLIECVPPCPPGSQYAACAFTDACMFDCMHVQAG